MRNTLSILFLLITSAASAQPKDRRAELGVNGRISEISVSPDEKIWLTTATGHTYYTNTIDSNWHYGTALFKDNGSIFDLYNPQLERISFFNRDTAIMTGYISTEKEGSVKNGYYFTKNGGKTWKLSDFGGNAWIYTICSDKSGHAWMGGLSKQVFYTDNYGKSFSTLTLPYKSSDRTYGIFMSSPVSGLASSDENEILVTDDNWKTVKHLKTPVDQKKYIPADDGGYVDTRISKILKWNDRIIVNQNGNIFYTDAKNIDWKKFPVPIVEFQTDPDNGQLFAVTDSLQLISFSDPVRYRILTDLKLSGSPIDMKIINHAVYLVCTGYKVYRFNDNILTRSNLYTADKKIDEPEIIKKSDKLSWGINGSQIYLSDNARHDWYRENALDFRIADVKLLNDSLAILWDGNKNNYLYSLSDHNPKIYLPENPVSGFLSTALKELSVNSGIQGCFSFSRNDVSYEKTNDSTFSTTESVLRTYQEQTPFGFSNNVSSKTLTHILSVIDSNPDALPSIRDFRISEDDKKNYLALIDTLIKTKIPDYIQRKKKLDKTFYYAVPAGLDTLSSTDLVKILGQEELYYSTTSNWFKIRMINQKNDTLNISRSFYVSNSAWNLPWKIEYKGMHFDSYSIELSAFINSCIPPGFLGKEFFDNRMLIMQIADYLFNKD